MNVEQVMFCTEPAHRDGAEMAYADAYKSFGIRMRPKAVWMPSPKAANRFAHRSGAEPVCGGKLRVEMFHALSVTMRQIDDATEWRPRIGLGDQTRMALYGAMTGAAGEALVFAGDQHVMCGQHDAETLWIVAMCIKHGIEVPGLLKAALQAAFDGGWWYALEGMVVAAERPVEVHRDADGRLHREGAMAMRWQDGWGVHCWHGTRVPAAVTMTPKNELTVAEVDAERNVEWRRVLIERMGYDRYMKEGDGHLVHEDECGKLWRRGAMVRRDQTRQGHGIFDFDPAQTIAVVEVVNATAEPNGTRRRYWLRVPPEMQTAREAVAWTFGLQESEYRPRRES